MSFDDQAAPDDQSAAAGRPTPDDQPDAGYQPDTDYQPFVEYQESAPADATRADPAAGPDPLFASWYRQDNPTDTVHVTPTEPLAQPQGYQSPPVSQGGPPGPPFSSAGPPQGTGRRGLFAVIAVVAVLVAGGGAYALASSLGRHPSAQPTASSTGQAGTSSASASPAASLVAVGPGMAASPAVETLLSHHFDGINKHDYPEYAATLNPAELAEQSQSTFDSGYSTTTDSGMTLTSLTDNGSGGLIATVTFTSRQAPAKSIDDSACNDWTLSLYLVSQGSGYLIGPAPSSYQPSHSDC
jgi:hypothetical protein